MPIPPTNESASRKPLRLWPGVVAAILLLLGRFVIPVFAPETLFYGVMGGLVFGLAIVIWWLFFSRAPWSERIGAIVLMAVVAFATSRILHPSIKGGMMGMMFPIYVTPVLMIAFVVWAVLTSRLSDGVRRVTMVLTILIACGAFALIRTNGMTGDAVSDLQWRWSQTPEERLLAQEKEPAPPPSTSKPVVTHQEPIPTQTSNEQTIPQSAPSVAKAPEETKIAQAGTEQKAPVAAPAEPEPKADWPGFRGPERDDIVRGVRIKTDWTASPPKELWRHPIGPGWSSFSVRGNFIYTQEQRGDDEMVSCYNLNNGEAVWRHRDAARFYESNAGAGPRGTPTLYNDRVYTFGATGILNALNASDGSVVWSRNVGTDSGKNVPGWGFASSPLVVDDVVVVAAAGKLVAYDISTGKPRWLGSDGHGGYSSPQLLTIDGVPQILLMSGNGVISVAPSDGKVNWEHKWKGDGIVQPAQTSDGDVLLGSGSGMDGAAGILRVAVQHGSGGWTAQERWKSIGLKPYFNDFVLHNGRAFGFDGSFLSCIDLSNGEKKWKGGHYGHGQLIALADQDVLLILSEQGEVALVSASADQFTELARFSAISGKTWNHPVLVGNTLLVRNGQEMAAFRLPSDH